MNNAWHKSLGLHWPIIQAAMGGGIATAELATAVSRAGGLGSIGLLPEGQFAQEITKARAALGDTPFAANLLMPLLRRGHIQACLDQQVPVVSLFYGYRRGLVDKLRAAGSYVIYQIGSREEADLAVREGADALIVQGTEAGGHVRATESLWPLLAAIRPAHPGVPMLAAGGIHDAASVRRAHAAGADGVNVGTRFLLTPEAHAHEAYKQRLLEADSTLLTRLFSLGWDAPHRVAANAATRRWCDADGSVPRWLSIFNRLSEAPTRLLPLRLAESLIRLQSPGRPFFSPFPLTRSMPARIDTTPLYAGAGVAQIYDIRPAVEVVAELAKGYET
ncbi:nitronate monooxygenase [Spectribacter hydrogenoxidans]|uniref:Nitronate monooxygenase n=1 Tax=Spectribacter hydrogenoxidans TaxID=3075608 RepID=A0ABU3C2A6_9GAMM|nr:nitronate monooxygenase [Salinisphaera sp. W335]MDT0635696.1 nitronate monooxygenase [Salinisphaera sp. W335]